MGGVFFGRYIKITEKTVPSPLMSSKGGTKWVLDTKLRDYDASQKGGTPYLDLRGWCVQISFFLEAQNIKITEKIEQLFKEIKEVNLNLWNIEDKLRVCEKNKDFGKNFIELARAIYFNNAKRSDIKSEINKTLGSNINEVKQYVNY